jgi:lipoprotein-anchoring transpeptidase ErfK/SrfK
LLAILSLSIITPLLTACGGNTGLWQQADTSKTSLDQTIHHALTIGVPATELQSIQKQYTTLADTNAPLALFNNKPVNDYYQNITFRYRMLDIQVQGVIQVATEQLGEQAQTSLQTLQNTLATKRSTNIPLGTITQLYNQNMANMKEAQYPKDYSTISTQASDATATLNAMPATLEKLNTLNQVITVMNEGHQDVASLKQQYTSDQSMVVKATKPSDLLKVNQSIEAQNQQAATQFKQAIPLITQAKLDELNSDVQQLKQDGTDTSQYQLRFNADQAQSANVKTLQDYLTFSKQVDSDIASMQTVLLKGQTTALIAKFHQEVQSWGNVHTFFDKYNGQTYPLDGPYMTKGIGEDLDRELNAAATASDYQQVLTDAQNEYFHLQMFETDSNDQTPYNQVHQTDLQLIDHYKLQNNQVIVVSFIEDALRLYDNGKLVRAFFVTAGRPELPPVPGLWSMMWRLTHTTFHSSYPPGSPYWYPDTPINYAMMYHSGGYFIHDSWWRNDYGPGTQFYHSDSSGNVSADYGTHGCVNMATPDAAWLYNNTSYGTAILMY